MSHTVGNQSGAIVILPITIVNYNAGGELVIVNGSVFSDSSAAPSDYMLQGTIAATQNSLGVVLFATFTNFVIRLYQITGGVLSEIPTTANLNANLHLIIKSS